MTTYRHIVALGSSFAAGPGIEPLEDPGAMRSSRNYAHLLAARLDAHLVDLSVSGATTATILDAPQLTMGGTTYPPQIEGVPANADVVTVTAGGNDLQFAGSMLYAAWSRFDPSSPVVAMMAPEFAGAVPLPSDAAIDAMAQGLIRTVIETRARAADARVILVDYLTVLDRDGGRGPDWPFTQDESDAFLRIQAGIVRGYEIAAERSGAELVRASALSTGHALGSTDPWVFGFQPSMEKIASSFHPNEKGMVAIADELARLLRG